MDGGIQFAELLDYTEEEAQRWKQFFAAHPEALALPLDIAGSVRELVLHIFDVELYFARVVAGSQNARPQESSVTTLEDIFARSAEAAKTYREFFAKAGPSDWSEVVDMNRINLKASKRKLVAQALTHSMRHWAQIATFLRQQGLKQDWRHDFLLTKAME